MAPEPTESAHHPDRLMKGQENVTRPGHGRNANSYDRASLILQLLQVFPMFVGLVGLVCPNNGFARLIAGLLLMGVFWITALSHKKT